MNWNVRSPASQISLQDAAQLLRNDDLDSVILILSGTLKKRLVLLSLLVGASIELLAAPISLHPENPRYFEWRGNLRHSSL